MPNITFVEHDGTRHIVDLKAGLSLMEGAVKNNVPGIDADCGGACACATCHVHVDEAWLEKVGMPLAMDQSMLDFAENAESRSRLSCQVTVREEINGLIVYLPESQH